MSHPPIPPILASVIACIAAAVPARGRATFLDLLLGAAATKSGHVTDAILASGLARGWSTYYWFLEQGRWSWLRVWAALLDVLTMLFRPAVWYAVIDDSVVERVSTAAPGSLTHHNHNAKPNRPKFLRGQGWLCLAAVIERNDFAVGAVPLLLRLVRRGTNRGKLRSAGLLLHLLGQRLGHARLADPPRPGRRPHRDRLRAPRSRPVRCAEAAPQTPLGAAAQVWRAADAGAGCGIAGAPQRRDPLRQAGSRALSHLPGCRAVPARAGGAGGVGGTGASRPARQTTPAAIADLHRPSAVRTAGDQRICQEMGGGVAVQEPQARLWPEGCTAAVASGADALGHRTGGRICDPADAGLHRPGAPGRLGPARPLACARHPHRRANPGRHRPDFTRGRAVGLYRGDLGKNRRRGIKHKRIVSAARRQSRVSHPTPPSSFRSRGANPAPRRRNVAWKLQIQILRPEIPRRDRVTAGAFKVGFEPFPGDGVAKARIAPVPILRIFRVEIR